MNRIIKYLLAVLFVLIVVFLMLKPDKKDAPEDLPSNKEDDIYTTIIIKEEPAQTSKVVEPEVVVDTESEPEVAEDKIIPAYNYTAEDLDLLSRLIYSEGGIESYETQLMIGSVVMNRVDSPKFPNTIREVIYQKNQFSVTFIYKGGIPMIDHPADEDAKRAALEILTYGSILPPDVQVFYNKSITSGWVATRKPYGTFDNTAFAYIYS